MKNRLTTILLCGLTALGTLAKPASAWDYNYCVGNRIDWGTTAVNFYPSRISFQPGAAKPALDAVQDAWNNHAPGTNFRFGFVYDDATTLQSGDGKNSVAFNSDYAWGNAIGVTLTRWNCGDLTEADVLFRQPDSTTSWTYVTSPPSPPSPYPPYYVTLVGIHEFGHAMGLNHQKSAVATMNDDYPDGGTLGNSNAIQPLPDDVLGDRVGYGTCCTERDVVASTYRSVSSVDTDRIPAPATAYRGYNTGFQFTIGNRGTVNESSVRVQFYLSTDRFISTSDTLLGAATFSLNAGTMSTFSASVPIPLSTPSGSYYLGYVVDPLGSIPEVDESNNAVALLSPTFVPSQSPPSACFTESPRVGVVPATISFNGSCSGDPDGSIVSYAWNFGDGAVGSGVNPSHTYYSTGTYTITLTVTDNSGLTSQTTDSVLITDSSGCIICN